MIKEKELVKSLAVGWCYPGLFAFLLLVLSTVLLHIPIKFAVVISGSIVLVPLPLITWAFARGYKRSLLVESVSGGLPRDTRRLRLIRILSILGLIFFVLSLLVLYLIVHYNGITPLVVLAIVSFLIIFGLILGTANQIRKLPHSIVLIEEKDLQTRFEHVTTGKIFWTFLPVHLWYLTGSLVLGVGAWAAIALEKPTYALLGGCCYVLSLSLGRFLVKQLGLRFSVLANQ